MVKRAAIIAVVSAAAILLALTTYIPGGRVGVAESEGGLTVLESGIHLRPRWRHTELYPVEPGRIELLAEPLTADGELRADVVLEISVERGHITRLHRTYGGAYADRLIRPIVEDAIAKSRTRGSGELERDLIDGLAPSLSPFGIEVYSVSVRGIEVTVTEADRRIKELARKHGGRVVILGIDALDWEIYELVSRDVAMPNIERIRNQGAAGDLISMEPPVSPMIWTTMATGVDPETHGIIDFLMKDPETGEDIPITSNMRKAPAIWNITTRFGMSSGFIGWLGTYPAEPVRGFQVSDRIVFHTFDPRWRKGEAAASPAEDLSGLTYPEDLIDEIKSRILTGEDISYETMKCYVDLEPTEMAASANTFDPLDPVINLRHIIASNTTYENLADFAYETRKPDILAVYLDMVDAVCHLFIKHMEPHTPDIADAQARKYGGAIAAAYSHTDSLIGEWLGKIDDETTLIVVSDHGFKHGDLRPAGPSAIGGGQAVKWHRMTGAIVMYGHRVKRGVTIKGASVRDVGPTVLRLLGLPAAEDMTGRVLEEAFEEEWLTASSRIPDVETYGTRSVAAAGVRRKGEEDAILKRLQALGYISGGATDYNKLAGSYFAKGDFDKAIDIWEAVLEEQPDNAEVMTAIANAQLHKGDLEEAAETARRAIAADAGFYAAHNLLALCYVNMEKLDEAEHLARYVISKDPRNAEAHFNLGVIYEKMGLNSPALNAFEKSVELRGDYDEARINLGSAYMRAGRIADARQQFEMALDLNPRSADAWFALGNSYRAENDNAKAIEYYRQAITAAPQYNPARISMAVLFASRGDYDEARDVLEEATQYKGDLEMVYTNLGILYLQLADQKRSRDCFDRAVEENPLYAPARLGLARLYLAQGKNREARREAQEALRLDPSDPEARVLLNAVDKATSCE